MGLLIRGLCCELVGLSEIYVSLMVRHKVDLNMNGCGSICPIIMGVQKLQYTLHKIMFYCYIHFMKYNQLQEERKFHVFFLNCYTKYARKLICEVCAN